MLIRVSRVLVEQRKKERNAYQELLRYGNHYLFPHASKDMKGLYARIRMSFLREFVIKSCKKSCLLVDVGCSDGYFLISLPTWFSKIGVDFVREIISKAKLTSVYLRRADVEFLISEASNLCLKHEVCDVIVCSELLEHTPNTLTVLQEARRILRKGGCLIISVPVLGIASYFLSKVTNKGSITFRSPQHLREYSYGGFGRTTNMMDLLKQLKKYGYQLSSIHNIGFLTSLSRFKTLQKIIIAVEKGISPKLPYWFGVLASGFTLIVCFRK